MLIAIISDTHFGHTRFGEDAFTQAESAFLDAKEKADLIIYAGDIFDSRIPKLETINRAALMLKKIDKPIFAIHGNHERRSKGMINAPQLLATMGVLRYIHNESVLFEKDGEKLLLFGLGNMPEEYVKVAIDSLVARSSFEEGVTSILILHQSIKEFVSEGEGLSIEELEDLPFDVIINGHIHQALIKMNGRLLIPGSTVVTQLRKEESADKGYLLYNTKTKSAEFVKIKSRPFFYDEIFFDGQKPSEARRILEQRISELASKAENPIIKIKLKGRLDGDLKSADLVFDSLEDVYVDNEIVGSGLKERIDRIKNLKGEGISIKDKAEKLFIEKSREKITIFDPREMLEYLASDPEEAFDYLMQRIKNQKAE